MPLLHAAGILVKCSISYCPAAWPAFLGLGLGGRFLTLGLLLVLVVVFFSPFLA